MYVHVHIHTYVHVCMTSVRVAYYRYHLTNAGYCGGSLSDITLCSCANIYLP